MMAHTKALPRATRIRRTGIFHQIQRVLALGKQRHDLNHLTDDQLADIGVTRTEAAQEASRAPWDAPQHWRMKP